MTQHMINLCLLCLVLALTAGCKCASAPGLGPDTTTAPSPTPSATEPALSPVRGPAKDLIIQLDDLPQGFQTVTAEPNGSKAYTAFYVRPEALATQGAVEENLLAVAVDLTIHDSAAEAEEAFAAEGDLDQGSLAAAMGEASPDATVIDVTSYPLALEEASEAAAFRVLYEIGPLSVIDYRYRFVVSNAEANVVVTAPAQEGGQDPPGLAERAQALAERQVSRLVEARE